MAEEMRPVDVEKIMQEIRKEIKEKGYNDSMLSFRDVKGSDFDLTELERNVQLATMRSRVPWFYELEGNPVAVVVKKVIRKLTAFMVAPMSDDQNNYNESVVECLSQLLLYVKVQEGVIEDMKERIKTLESAQKENVD